MSDPLFRHSLHDLPVSELFWWALTSLDRARACLSEIGRRYEGVPSWEIALDEAERARKSTEYHQKALEKWLINNPEEPNGQ